MSELESLMNKEKEVIVIDKNLLIAIVKECQSRVEDVRCYR